MYRSHRQWVHNADEADSRHTRPQPHIAVVVVESTAADFGDGEPRDCREHGQHERCVRLWQIFEPKNAVLAVKNKKIVSDDVQTKLQANANINTHTTYKH